MREAAVHIVQTLRDAGHEAYLAGGCVRDRLMGREPKDYDVATSAPPEAVRKLFRRSRGVGESFGVVLVTVGKVAVEVATFRSEWGYHDGRRPDHVIFTDAEHDAQRRDFTINGLFEDPIEDRVIDFVGGRADIEAGVIRAIGNADERFAEDYLRMLRAVRFAARFGYAIEQTTARAIRNHARHLGQISRERIGQEVRMMLSPASARLLSELKLDGPTLLEDHQDAPPEVLAKLPTTSDYPAKLAAWLLDRGGDLSRWRKALNLSNGERDAARDALHALDAARDWASMNVARRKRLLASAGWPRARLLLAATDRAAFERVEAEAKPLFDEGVAPPPLVTGDDLVALGLPPGPRIGRLLYAAYDAQLAGEFATRDAAIAWVKQRL